MNPKLELLHNHLDFISKGDVRKEKEVQFHYIIKEMDKRYQEWWHINMIGNYC